jgi:hypothetical protein
MPNPVHPSWVILCLGIGRLEDQRSTQKKDRKTENGFQVRVRGLHGEIAFQELTLEVGWF